MEEVQDVLETEEAPLIGDVHASNGNGNGNGIGRIKPLMEIPTAAELAGFSVRHFRRIIEANGIRICPIRGKFFIAARDFADWQESVRSGSPIKSRIKKEKQTEFPGLDVLNPQLASIDTIQFVISEWYGADPLAHPWQYYHRASQQAFAAFAYLLYNDLSLSYKEIAKGAGIRHPRYVANCVYRFTNRVSFHHDTHKDFREIRETIQHIESSRDNGSSNGMARRADRFRAELEELQTVSERDRMHRVLKRSCLVDGAANDFGIEASELVIRCKKFGLMKELGELVPSGSRESRSRVDHLKQVLRESQSLAELTRLLAVNSDHEVVAEYRNTGLLMELMNFLVNTPERRQFQLVLQESSSIIEAAERLDLKVRILLVKCQSFGLKDELTRLLG